MAAPSAAHLAAHLLASSGQSNFLVPNATFIAEIVGFAVFLAVIWRYVVPPLQRAMTQRQETIERRLSESEEAKRRLEAAEREHREALAQTRQELASIREQAHRDAQQSKDEILAQAREEAERIRHRAEEALTAERHRAFDELRAEIGRLAVELAGRLVGEALTDEALAHRVVDRFLADLGEQEPVERVP
jgi:F-type H+-transporting ATPase subunit b